ncbi:MAG TPA: hypothetical protein VG733_08015 [Chthoniobacteraceae bacterium]|nr:hypothetical protein [Chthoniobacteraceae bacterium]
MVVVLTVTEFHTAKQTLDLSSCTWDGSAHFEDVTRILLGERELSNAYELIDWTELDAVHFIVCDLCGMGEGAGVAAMRNLPDGVILITPYEKRLQNPGFEFLYTPLEAVRKSGSLFFPTAFYAKLREAFSAFPDREQIPALYTYEALRMFQSDAPFHLLDKGFDVSPASTRPVVAASEGELGTYEALLASLFPVNAPPVVPVDARVDAIPPGAKIISLYVDDEPGIPEWQAFVETDGIGLRLSERHQLKLGQGK